MKFKRQKNGTVASSTGTIYGIYDLSGGSWERTSAMINNKEKNLYIYGNELMKNLNNGGSSKYVIVYPYDFNEDSITSANIDNASLLNYDKNSKIYGDAIRETSIKGIGESSWGSDFSYFTSKNMVFSARGGDYGSKTKSGLFAFHRADGTSFYGRGFRSVLVSM